MLTLPGTSGFAPFGEFMILLSRNIYIVCCRVCQFKDYVCGLMTGLFAWIGLAALSRLMTGLFAWIGLAALSRTYCIISWIFPT